MSQNTTPTSQPPPVADASDDASCEYCGRRFPREDLLALHRGLDHPGEITDEERAAFEDARAAEAESLRLFRLRVVLVLVVVYFGFVMVYALV